MTVTEWRLRRPQDSATDTDLFDVYHKDAYNRFAREAKVWLEDPDGDKEDLYPRFTNVELDVKRDIDPSFIEPRFGGYVAETEHKSNDRHTILRCLSFDAFLRQKPVTRGYSNQKISYVLEDLISDNEITPVQWNASNVTVNNDVEITREWKGIPLDDVLEELSNRSAGEEWGATNGNEFFFRPVGTNNAPRDFTEGEYFDASFGEDAKKAVFRVTVHYGDVSADGSTDNRDAIQIDKSGEQSTAGSRLGTSADVKVELQKYFPEITSQSGAERKGRDILARHSPITIGNIETWEAFDVYPGDKTFVEVPTNNTSGEFVVAQIEHKWRDDTTSVRLAENDTGVMDTLVVAADEIERLDGRGIDATATPDQSVDLDLGATMILDHGVRIDKTETVTKTFAFGVQSGDLGDKEVGGGVLGDSALSTSTTTIYDST